MSSFYEWETTDLLRGRSPQVCYGLAKYRKIRKQAALVRYSPGLAEVVAYFRTEAAAFEFAAEFGLDVEHYYEVKA